MSAGYSVDTRELRNAAQWSEHQSDPAPDWDRLLSEAADDIDALRERIKQDAEWMDDEEGVLEPLSVRDYLTGNY